MLLNPALAALAAVTDNYFEVNRQEDCIGSLTT